MEILARDGASVSRAALTPMCKSPTTCSVECDRLIADGRRPCGAAALSYR
jgi:hypothetical protein